MRDHSDDDAEQTVETARVAPFAQAATAPWEASIAQAASTARDDRAEADRAMRAVALEAGVAPDELLLPGTVVARFIVHRVLGAGGAGVVYAAYDPQLDRTIALKIVRREVAARADARARFLREAQALARLSHPNVISVYDVGSIDGLAFISMEYIHGGTFADWLAASPRSWSQIVAVLVKVGRGLAAAHAAGIIHRDFKPANLLVGDNGRIVVTDFGLARAIETPADATPDPDPTREHVSRSLARSSALATAITRTGAVQGTPGYMAPEQRDGQIADARADQFGFCVTLHEAVFGVHPFSPQPRSKDRRSVPVWLQRVVQRGMSERPDDRYPSMNDLLNALVHEPVRRRRRIQLGAVAMALAGAGIAVHAFREQSGVEQCAGAASQLATIWNPAVRVDVATAFMGTRLPYALEAWRRVSPIVDAYAGQWREMHTDACQATRVRGEQSELMMDRRMACLDVRRRELDQLTRLLLHPDADVVEHAVQAARGLSAIQGCGDLAALVRRIALPSDPISAAQVGAARARLADARVLHDAGMYADALALLSGLAVEPVARDYLPLRAEVAYAIGHLHVSRAEWKLAIPHLQDAIWVAEASGHDELDLAALGTAASTMASLDRFKEADDLIRRGEAALLRVAGAPLQRAAFRTEICIALDREGRYAEAREQCQQALDLRRRELGPDHPDVATALYRLGKEAGRYAGADSPGQAIGYFREALAIEESALGPEHPELQRTLIAMGDAEVQVGRLDDALLHDQRALAIAEHALGPDSMRLFSVLVSLGNVLRLVHREAEAGELFRRAISIAERAVGPEHSETAIAHLRLGDVLQAQTDYATALQHYQRAVSILATTIGTAHPNHAVALLDVCSMELELKRPRDALSPCVRGLALLEQALGRDAPAVADALVGMIDRVYAANGMMREALEALERGIATWSKDDPTASAKIADGELTLAQTIWDYAPSHRARARSLATRARDRLGDTTATAARRAADAWLSAHR